jgi:hypothetical protein
VKATQLRKMLVVVAEGKGEVSVDVGDEYQLG